VNVVSEKKLVNYLSDNQTLLAEVNNLRTEVRNLSMENQKLMAQMEFSNSIRSRNNHIMIHVINSVLNFFVLCFLVSIPNKGSKKSSSHIMTEEDMSHNESISSCSDGEGDGSQHKMVREMTRAQLIREKSRRKRQKSVGQRQSSAENSRHSRRPSMDNLSAIEEPPYDSDGNSLSPAVLTAAAASIVAGDMSTWNSVPAILTDAIDDSTHLRHITPRVQIPTAGVVAVGGKSVGSRLPYPSKHSGSNQSSRHHLDSPATPAPGAEVLPNQRQKLDEHMKKYSNYAKERGSGEF
jgi:hypothetical protein